MFIQDVNENFYVTEELLDLVSLHFGTRLESDLFLEVMNSSILTDQND